MHRGRFIQVGNCFDCQCTFASNEQADMLKWKMVFMCILTVKGTHLGFQVKEEGGQCSQLLVCNFSVNDKINNDNDKKNCQNVYI